MAANRLTGNLVIASKDLSANYPMTQYLMAPSGFYLKNTCRPHNTAGTNWWQSTVTKSANHTNVALTHM